MVTTYRIYNNIIELSFSDVPPENIRDSLKATGWKWDNKNRCWRHFKNVESVTFAKALSKMNPDSEQPESKGKRNALESKYFYSDKIVEIICLYTEYSQKYISLQSTVSEKCCNGIRLKYEKKLVKISNGNRTIIGEGYYCPRCHKLFFNREKLHKSVNSSNSYLLNTQLKYVEIGINVLNKRVDISPVHLNDKTTYEEKYTQNVKAHIVMRTFIMRLDISVIERILDAYGYTLDSFSHLPINTELDKTICNQLLVKSINELCNIPQNTMKSYIHSVISSRELNRVLLSEDGKDNRNHIVQYKYNISKNMKLELNLPCTLSPISNRGYLIRINGETITIKFLCRNSKSIFKYKLLDDYIGIKKLTELDKYKTLCRNMSDGIINDPPASKHKNPTIPEYKDARLLSVADFLVRSTNYACINNKHELIRINAAVKVKSPNTLYEVQIPAAYCSKCDRYYILERNYESLKRYGYICCKVDKFEVLKKNEGSISAFQDKSLLYIYGYNVDSQQDLSETERHKILDFVIANGIQTKHQVINRLEQNISLRKNNPSMYNAIQKWEDDIEYIRKYQNVAGVVRVDSISVPVKRVVIK